MLQVCLLFLLALEAEGGWLESLTGGSIRGTLLLLIAFEGLLGGYAYVSTFSRLSSTDEETEDGLDHAVAVARKEFRMG